jgi:HEPN domain-containing protein
MEGPQPHWPKNFLVTHAVELVIKAFIVTVYEEPPHIHDLVKLYEKAVSHGLPHDQGVANDLAQLNDLHDSFYARYPHPESKPVPMISQYDDTVDRLFDEVTKTGFSLKLR